MLSIRKGVVRESRVRGQAAVGGINLNIGAAPFDMLTRIVEGRKSRAKGYPDRTKFFDTDFPLFLRPLSPPLSRPVTLFLLSFPLKHYFLSFLSNELFAVLSRSFRLR